jgi:predicted alpha-1,2-mannosidase
MRIRIVALAVCAAFAFALPMRAAVGDPVLLVDPFVGTSGTLAGGPIDTFPGVDVPFGMVQWSPDTPSQNAGGGYEYGDSAITGFSLTHLSGPGCSVFGDFGILPTVGAIGDPLTAKQPFSHATEVTAPGWYAVTVGNPGIRTELTVTTRTGLGRFTYPATTQANLIFNAASDQAGVTAAHVQIDGNDAIEGSASSGSFCGMPDTFNVYFYAQFDRPFVTSGVAKNRVGWVTFDTTADRSVEVKVGLSFVSVAGARANLRAENRGWDQVAVRNAATAQWSALLNRISIDGGTKDRQTIFYTALYHALLHPNVFSDVDGQYAGFDGRAHHVRPGHTEYANFSDWDIYRSQVPLMALLVPKRASDMMQSLVDAANQEGGQLPRWALANGPTSVMGGDSVDPVIAGAYAFGASDFDLRGALTAMSKGASDPNVQPAMGWYVERPELGDYLSRGYIVNTHVTSVSPVPNGASETLEYALDDFSIARFARAIGDSSAYHTYLQRSQNWANLLDTATGWIAPRDVAGAFEQTPLTDNGQSGFQEGNAAQYTWMVPQDLADLAQGLGGRQAAAAKLDTFFSQLNSDQSHPYAWLGNEPSLGSPWVYLSLGEPWRTQTIVRQAIDTLYLNTPEGLPGNDDLGEMSAWYVWSAIGLYPQNPSVRGLDIGSPEFTHVVVRAPGGPTIRIDAPNAASNAPYVRSLRVDGKLSQATWVPVPLHGVLSLAFDLSTTPNTTRGTAPADAPPSYRATPVTFPAASSATTSSGPMTTLAPGGSAALSASVVNSAGTQPVAVTWRASAPSGFTLLPASGSVATSAGMTTPISTTLHVGSDVAPGLYDVPFSAVAANGAILPTAFAVVRVAAPGQAISLAYVENYGDGTVTPVDLRTRAVGIPIVVGTGPRDAAVSRDGARLYVANRNSNTVSAIDTRDARVFAPIKVGSNPSGTALTPDGSTVWVANSGDNNVQPIDTTTLQAGTPISVGASPRDIVIAPDGLHLYVTDQGSTQVTPIDLRTRTALAPIAVGANPTGITISRDGKTVYVANNGSGTITAIDVADGITHAIPAGIVPQMMAFSPDGKTLYVTNYGGYTVTPIDLTTGTARAAIRVGGAPDGILLSPDGATLWIVNRMDSDIVPLDLASGTVGIPIQVGGTPLSIAAPPPP